MSDVIDQIIHPQQIPPSPRQGPVLIVGLGNPGRKFEFNRHNLGFSLLDRLASRMGESFNQVQSRALVAKHTFLGEKVILIKPQTYMNNSGSAVSSLVRFYQVPLPNLLVAYDDIDLPLGTLRMRPFGGSAGHKGMESIIQRLGTEDFPRLRIGTGRPPGHKEAADYVLRNFSADERLLLDETLNRALEAVLTFLQHGLEQAMNTFNG